MSETSLPPLTWLRAFEASARHLSFTQAAGELNLKQSAISQYVRSLESFLGREIFIRRTQALSLTEAGANYLPVMQEAFDVLAVGTRAFTGGDRGLRLMINCNMAFSTFWLAPRLSDLLAEAPWLSLNIVTPIWDPERSAAATEVEVRFGRAATMPDSARRISSEEAYPDCAPLLIGAARDWKQAALFDCAGIVTGWEAWLGGSETEIADEEDDLACLHLRCGDDGGPARRRTRHVARYLDRRIAQGGAVVQPYEFRLPMAEAYFLLSTPKHEATPASHVFNT